MTYALIGCLRLGQTSRSDIATLNSSDDFLMYVEVVIITVKALIIV